ncbi:RF-1 domain-containing protein [Desarmillaria tabescens]|uniref:RF-1 domain-containing protein n=1 Tax=Armillaria tabescens TaxID=1929756 RepID=A0AA39KIB7_ARMTA|nr:RF-1 domain-containing protein [Desarmillaria tabescens]KAK0459553.1 RF-1 domain-containing protein [Desarmillaria tabescens]
MSITPELRALARSAYRQLFRASAVTFSGDEPVLRAFRSKLREDALSGQAETDPVHYQEQTDGALKVAAFLRQNVIQASRVAGEEDTWKLRITKDTELGSNDSIKNPPPMETDRQARRREKQHNLSDAARPDNIVRVPRMNFSVLKKAHKERVIPELREEDLEETFVRGSGPGGQSINKTENNVQLLHKPTMIRVSCQLTRSLEQNRKLARRLLVEKLDKLANPGLSKEEMRRAKQRERERRRRKKAKKKASKNDTEEAES